ncbi:carbon-nitrogen hydrolase, putative [Ixodes scapularis]|uniref:omega-amidase n=1 Tax=Ixodes scapularis TaxID=6945 RepID=B7QCP4_IXOSC|nr:carbon-nitrogen hydrolase, putative [Ixodes scapularis]|eukprot:XP_002413308.1 carbon-nitrogen hydrolase, putative [Ixodes scapularis]
MLGKPFKLRLFEIKIPGKITFVENDFYADGDTLTTIDTPFCRLGISVCHDIPFPLLAQPHAQVGCKLMVLPDAFSMTTGRSHWKLLSRIRAVDNQVHVALVSSARDETGSYDTWGHSMLVDPAGKMGQSAGTAEELVPAIVDLQYLAAERLQMLMVEYKRG